MNEIILQTTDLTIGYTPSRRPTVTVVEDITFSLKAGELVCLIGPNGAGKSTLLRTIAGMQPPLAGRVELLGDAVHRLSTAELAKRVSIVLTERVNTGLLTGYALVALGRHPYTDWAGRLSADDEAIVRWAVEAVGAQELAPRYVSELSDGEQQKLMIARALAQEPRLMILDEPTAYLDLPRRVEIMQLLRSLARHTQQAVLLATHDLDLALRTADRICLLPVGGPLQIGAPEDLVLSGAFEAAFHSEGVEFDAQNGSFKLRSDTIGEITLVGEGIPALWTRRALEREGFSIASNGSPTLAHIEIHSGNNGDAHRWHLTHAVAHTAMPTPAEEYTSLYDLVAAVQMLTEKRIVL